MQKEASVAPAKTLLGCPKPPPERWCHQTIQRAHEKTKLPSGLLEHQLSRSRIACMCLTPVMCNATLVWKRPDLNISTAYIFSIPTGLLVRVTTMSAVCHLSRVGPPDDHMSVERVELSRKHGALGRQLILRPVLHRHGPVNPPTTEIAKEK